MRGEGQKVTFNDLILTFVSQTLKQTLQHDFGDNYSKHITMCCPMSLRPPPKGIRDFSYDNDFSIMPLRVRLVDDFDTGLPQINSDMDKLKKSLEPIGIYWMVQSIMKAPNFLSRVLFEDHAKKMTLGFSNVPGPRQPFIVNGLRCKSMTFMMPVGMTLGCSVGIISHVDTIKVCIAVDRALEIDPKRMIERLGDNMDAVFGTRWRDYKAGTVY